MFEHCLSYLQKDACCCIQLLVLHSSHMIWTNHLTSDGLCFYFYKMKLFPLIEIL